MGLLDAEIEVRFDESVPEAERKDLLAKLRKQTELINSAAEADSLTENDLDALRQITAIVITSRPISGGHAAGMVDLTTGVVTLNAGELVKEPVAYGASKLAHEGYHRVLFNLGKFQRGTTRDDAMAEAWAYGFQADIGQRLGVSDWYMNWIREQERLYLDGEMDEFLRQRKR